VHSRGGKFKEAISRCGCNQECYASVYNGLGVSHEELGDDKTALYYYEKAISLARRLGNLEWLADDLFLAAGIYIAVV